MDYRDAIGIIIKEGKEFETIHLLLRSISTENSILRNNLKEANKSLELIQKINALSNMANEAIDELTRYKKHNAMVWF